MAEDLDASTMRQILNAPYWVSETSITQHFSCLLVASLLSMIFPLVFAQYSEKYLFVLPFSLGIPDGSRIQRNLVIIKAEGINHDPKYH